VNCPSGKLLHTVSCLLCLEINLDSDFCAPSIFSLTALLVYTRLAAGETGCMAGGATDGPPLSDTLLCLWFYFLHADLKKDFLDLLRTFTGVCIVTPGNVGVGV